MQMWATFAVIGAAIVLFALERVAVEVIALGVIIALLVLFYFFPVIGPRASPRSRLTTFWPDSPIPP
jgi:hypothetical protein